MTTTKYRTSASVNRKPVLTKTYDLLSSSRIFSIIISSILETRSACVTHKPTKLHHTTSELRFILCKVSKSKRRGRDCSILGLHPRSPHLSHLDPANYLTSLRFIVVCLGPFKQMCFKLVHNNFLPKYF